MKVFEIIATGVQATIQDWGRAGWRRFGVPSGGVMDRQAAEWANQLLENPPGAPVLELLYGGAELRALRDVWVAVTGPPQELNLETGSATRLSRGDVLSFGRHRAGMWSYVAVKGGFKGPRFLGSVSAYPRGGIGSRLAPGGILEGDATSPSGAALAGRARSVVEPRSYDAPGEVGVWRGPQWHLFDQASQTGLLEAEWTVTAQSDRVGYWLSGPPLRNGGSLLSEPVLVGSIQVPENGQPIVTMRDGPTVGGYAKIGLVHAQDLSALAQCEPGRKLRFRPAG